jgi:hypothetical protein
MLLEHHALYAAAVQELGEQQARRAGADDGDLRPNGATPALAAWSERRIG